MPSNLNNEKKAKKGLFAGMGGIGGWVSALMGKKTTTTPPETETPKAAPEPQKVSPKESITGVLEEDSITTDVKNFKQFVKKTAETVAPKVTPIAQKGSHGVSSAFDFLETTAGKIFLRRIIRSFLIVFFVMVLVFVGIRLFDSLNQGPTTPDITAVPATPVEYKPPKESVYAKDAEILNMEEDLNVLEKELSRTSLREDRLFPPDLDFNISF